MQREPVSGGVRVPVRRVTLVPEYLDVHVAIQQCVQSLGVVFVKRGHAGVTGYDHEVVLWCLHGLVRGNGDQLRRYLPGPDPDHATRNLHPGRGNIGDRRFRSSRARAPHRGASARGHPHRLWTPSTKRSPAVDGRRRNARDRSTPRGEGREHREMRRPSTCGGAQHRQRTKKMDFASRGDIAVGAAGRGVPRLSATESK